MQIRVEGTALRLAGDPPTPAEATAGAAVPYAPAVCQRPRDLRRRGELDRGGSNRSERHGRVRSRLVHRRERRGGGVGGVERARAPSFRDDVHLRRRCRGTIRRGKRLHRPTRFDPRRPTRTSKVSTSWTRRTTNTRRRTSVACRGPCRRASCTTPPRAPPSDSRSIPRATIRPNRRRRRTTRFAAVPAYEPATDPSTPTPPPPALDAVEAPGASGERMVHPCDGASAWSEDVAAACWDAATTFGRVRLGRRARRRRFRPRLDRVRRQLGPSNVARVFERHRGGSER